MMTNDNGEDAVNDNKQGDVYERNEADDDVQEDHINDDNRVLWLMRLFVFSAACDYVVFLRSQGSVMFCLQRSLRKKKSLYEWYRPSGKQRREGCWYRASKIQLGYYVK